MNKLEKANVIVRDCIKKNYHKHDWRYSDFVNHDRFLHEIKTDPNIILAEMTAEEIAEYALENICNVSVMDFVS